MIASEIDTRATTSSRVPRGRGCVTTPGLPPAARAHQDALEDLELFEALPRAEHHRLQRRVGDPDRHPGLVTEPLVQPAEERAAAGEHDAAIHDVRGELGWGPIERGLDRVDDGVHRLLDRAADLFRADRDRLRQTGDEVATLD